MIKNIFKTATLRASAITFSGTIINGILGALFYIVIARSLGPMQFGLLTISIAVLTLISDIADLGTNTGLIRHVSACLDHNYQLSLKYLKVSLQIKLVVWLVVLILGLILSPIVADLFHKPELTIPLRLVMVGVGGALLFSFATSALQASQKFVSWGLVNISTNLLRLILALVLISMVGLDLKSALVIYILLPFLGFFLSLWILPTRDFLKVGVEPALLERFFDYNKWVAYFTVISAVSSRMDVFLNARLLNAHEVGLYGVANQLTTVWPQLVGALGTVAAPKFASFNNIKEMMTYFKKLQLMVLGIAFLGLLVLPLVMWFIPVFYGQSYAGSVLPFGVLFISMLIFLISVPAHNAIIYYFSKPQFFVWLSFGYLLIVSGLGYVLIGNYGILGAAVTVLLGNLFNLLIPIIYFIKKARS